MDLLLHVGPHKTGTTTVQKFLYKHRSELLKYNILYPDAGIYNSQHSLIPLSQFRKQGLFKNLSKDQQNLDFLLESLKKELDKYNPSLTIMSSEAWSRRYIYLDSRFFKLMSKLRPLFNKTTIILSKRNVKHQALSTLKHVLRNNKNNNLKIINHKYIELYFDILNDIRNNYNFWENYELPLIIKNLENATGNLVDHYFGESIEKYSKEASLILQNNEEKIENKDPIKSYQYLGIFLYEKREAYIDFLKTFLISQKEHIKEVTNEQLILYFEFFKKRYEDKNLENINWEDKISALKYAKILK